MIPAHAPDRVGGGVRIAFEATRARDIGELIAANDLPFVADAVPGREHAGRNIRPLAGQRATALDKPPW